MCLSQKKYHFFKSCALGARSVTFLISLCLSEHAPELSPSDRNPYTRYRAVAARDTRYRPFSFFAASVKGGGASSQQPSKSSPGWLRCPPTD